MSNKQLVLAVFADEAAADSAVETVRAWEKNYDGVHIDAIGVLVLDDHGKIKTHKAGGRSVGKGMGIGMILAMATPPGLVAGLVVGGALGAMHRKGLGLDADAREQLGRHLEGGKAAVGVLSEPGLASGIASILKDIGGEPEVHEISEEAVDEAETVADEVPAEPAAEA